MYIHIHTYIYTHISIYLSIYPSTSTSIYSCPRSRGEAVSFESPPLEYCWLYPVFEAVGYGEIQRDTARYS